MNVYLLYIIFWSLIGCALFFTLVVAFFRIGLVYTARRPDGTLKDEIPLSGKLTMLIVPISFFIFQLLSNYLGLVQQEIFLDTERLFFINYAVYLILFLFDTLFIDWYVLSIWRPAFLQIPDEMGKESMKKHIPISIPIGFVIGAVLTLISTTTSYFLWMI